MKITIELEATDDLSGIDKWVGESGFKFRISSQSNTREFLTALAENNIAFNFVPRKKTPKRSWWKS
jgi:hypothetical protein